jgi:hypothetical protein
MKIFQTIHKYSPHIPQFEKKHGISDESNITFNELRRLIVGDGYASSYILLPALQFKFDEVFYTIWDYERLQLLWAKENNIQSTDLNIIKIEQLKWFKPDVFYNHSAFCDGDFIELVKLEGLDFKTVCWNGIIKPKPQTFPFYDVHVSLHRPYIEYWRKLGLNASELQPGIPFQWSGINDNRPIDVLFYGQYFQGMFDNRNRLLDQLIDYKTSSEKQIEIHLQYKLKKKQFIKIPKVIDYKITQFPCVKTVSNSLPPIYGQDLYQKIRNSKIVVNAYTNDNDDFKSNMRVFESIGNGALLISERGNYPDGLIPDEDFLTYEGFDELIEKIELALGNWDLYRQLARKASEKAKSIFSKEYQWKKFKEIVS